MSFDYAAVRARLDRRCHTELGWSAHDALVLDFNAVARLAMDEVKAQEQLEEIRA